MYRIRTDVRTTLALWSNYTPNPEQHRDKTGWYCVRHTPTGLCYVSVTDDLHGSLVATARSVRSGKFRSQRLHQLYKQAPEFEIEFGLANEQLPRSEQRLHAAIAAHRFQTRLGELCLNERRAHIPHHVRSGLEAHKLLDPQERARTEKKAEAPSKRAAGVSQSFWQNTTLNKAEHRDKTACYVIKHVATGKCSVGMTSNLLRAMSATATCLRGGRHASAVLSFLYEQDPRFELSFEIFDAPLSPLERQNRAARRALQLQEQLGALCVNSQSAKTQLKRLVSAEECDDMKPRTSRKAKARPEEAFPLKQNKAGGWYRWIPANAQHWSRPAVPEQA